MFGPVGFQEFCIIVLALIILFGGGRLPDLIRSVLQGIHRIKQTACETVQDVQDMVEDEIKRQL